MSNWQRRKTMYSTDMLLLMKGNVDAWCKREQNSSAFAQWAFPPATASKEWAGNTYGALFYALSIWQQPYEGNTIGVPILQMKKLKYKGANYLLKVTELGAGLGGRQTHSNKYSGSRAKALIFSTFFSILHPFTHFSIVFLPASVRVLPTVVL